jgi:hypothetical protein
MIEQILLIILLFTYIINIVNIITLIWYNDYFKKNYDNCYISNNTSLYELETYRNKLADFLYNSENNNLKNIETNIIITSYIIISTMILLLLLSIKYSYYNTNNNLFTIFLFMILIVYYVISNEIKKKINNIKKLKFDKSEQIYKYNLSFKILNSLLYLNNSDNVFNEIFEYNTKSVKNEKTFEEKLSINIGNIHNTNNKREIEYIKSKSINNLNFLNYINLNEISPFYFKKYFTNLYIKIGDDIIYIKNIKDINYINKIIKENLLKSGEKEEDIANIDYIKYYNENKNLIFKLKNIRGKIVDNLNTYNDLIYHIILLLLILKIILHYIYYKSTSNIYIIILLTILIVFGIYIGLKLNSN